MLLRRSTIFLGTIAILSLTLTGIFMHATGKVMASEALFARRNTLVRQLELTDLCLFNEASYTRHPTMSDLSTPFQDAPMSMEHFPSGALLEPPPHLVKKYVQQD